MKINGLTFDPPLILAPMAGVTGRAYRELIRQNNPGAVGLFYTEFASVEGLVRHNRPTLRLVTRAATDRATPFAAQIFGADPDRMREGGHIAEEMGADIVDLNAGCPAPKVVKKGGGSELLKKLPLLGRIVASVKSGVRVPVTVKIRIGWDDDTINVLDTVRVLTENGADAVIIHGRTRMQSFKGEADWNWVREVRARFTIPVIGNGDIVTPEQALARFAETGAHGIMLGRGVQRDPWLFSKIAALARGLPPVEPSLEVRRGIFRRYAELLREDGLPEKAVLGVLKQLTVKFLRGRPGGAEIRTRALRSLEMDAFFSAAESYFEP
ncbi:MAG: tRNA-dihydrouridine synthase [Fibrobacterota bacterium]